MDPETGQLTYYVGKRNGVKGSILVRHVKDIYAGTQIDKTQR